MTREKLGHGVFAWNGEERRSDRYGAFVMSDSPYASKPAAKAKTNQTLLNSLVGKRVRLVAKVIENRESGHLGDLFHKISPTKPEVGEEIDLGVGTLLTEPSWEEGTPCIILKPGDGRPTLWLDPRKLYRLHDQTVDLYVEETTDPFSEAPDLTLKEDPGVLDSGESDRSLQVKQVPLPTKVAPVFEEVGDGMFIMDWTPKKGRRFNAT